MSLINEALRKARQAASEHESKPPAGPFQPTRAYPSRRSGRRTGLLGIVMVAIAASVIGAAAAWWLLVDHEPDLTDTTTIENPSIAAVTPAPTPQSSPSPVEDQANPVEIAKPSATGLTPVVAPASEELMVELDNPAPTPIEPATGPNGERIFVMEAELGYASLSLGYIVARSNNAFAEINGTEVWIDSEIEGFVVEAIEADRVVLRDDKGPLILRVP